MKSHNLNLTEQVEDDKLKLQESESARKELNNVRLVALHSILYE